MTDEDLLADLVIQRLVADIAVNPKEHDDAQDGSGVRHGDPGRCRLGRCLEVPRLAAGRFTWLLLGGSDRVLQASLLGVR